MQKVAFLFILFLALHVAGQEKEAEKQIEKTPDTQSSVASVYKLDTSATTDFNLDANFELKKGSHLLVGYETTHSPSSATTASGLITDELRLGLSGDFREDYSYTVNYVLWGAPGQISTNTFSLELRWLGDNWISTVEPAVRFIAVPIQNDAVLKKLEGNAAPTQVIISDPSLTASANYVALDPWHFKLTAGYFSYSRSLSTIFSASFSRFFSSSAINSASNFNEALGIFEVGYGFKNFSLAAEYEYAISALDYSAQQTFTAKAIIYLFKNFDIEVDGGQTPGVGAGSSSVNFVSLGLTYYW